MYIHVCMGLYICWIVCTYILVGGRRERGENYICTCNGRMYVCLEYAHRLNFLGILGEMICASL